MCLCVLQDLVEKLRSQLDAARRARESLAARKKLQEEAKSNQVCGYCMCVLHSCYPTNVSRRGDKIIDASLSRTKYNSAPNSTSSTAFKMISLLNTFNKNSTL